MLDRSDASLYRNTLYDLALELVVPLNTHNAELGNFMASLEVMPSRGEPLYTVSVPSIVPPVPERSLLGGLLPSLSTTAPGLGRNTAKLTIPLIRGASDLHRASSASIEVGRRDAHWPGHEGTWRITKGQGELQVYSATLKIEARLTGIRYMLYSHPVISFVVFTTLFEAFELFGALCIWLYFAARPVALEEASSIDRKPAQEAKTVPPSVKREDDDESVATSTRTPTETATAEEGGSSPASEHSSSWEGVAGEGKDGAEEAERAASATTRPTAASTFGRFSSSAGQSSTY